MLNLTETEFAGIFQCSHYDDVYSIDKLSVLIEVCSCHMKTTRQPYHNIIQWGHPLFLVWLVLLILWMT